MENTGFKFESRIFYFIDLQNEEDYERKESSSIIRKTTRTNFQNEAVRYFYSLPKRSGSFWYKLQGTVSKLPCPCA